MTDTNLQLEVAQLIVYLLSQEADYITGQNIEIAGGLGLV